MRPLFFTVMDANRHMDARRTPKRNRPISKCSPKARKRAAFSRKRLFNLVRQKGLEPPTFWFVAKHSIQLSYWRIRSHLMLHR